MVQELSRKDPDGWRLGQTDADLGAFFGKTPIVQPAATAQSALATATLTTITDVVTTASLTAAFNAVVARVSALTVLVNQMRTDNINLGLMKGSI